MNGRIAAFLRNAERVFRGRWIDDLQGAIADLRHAVEVISLNRNYDPAFAIEHSARRMAEPCGSPPEIAVVSCMPPAQTGIATATLLTFRASVFPVDIYADYAEADDYFSAITDERLSHARVRIFHLGALALGQQAVKYRAQVFMVGNSNHNLPIARALRRYRHFPPRCRLAVHIHDPCLLNVLALCLREERWSTRQVIKSHYGIDVGDDAPHQRMVDAGIFGIRPLIDDLDIDLVTVNSTAAAEIVRRELPDCRVEVLFHPVFEPAGGAMWARNSGLRIGSFGVPGGAKRTEVVIDSFEAIRRERPDARLVIAGFDALPFAQKFNLTPERGYEIHDSPSDRKFDRLLASVDVAVQLRKQNLGESSGVMARLAGMDIPVVTSPGGAFAEYATFAQVLEAHEGAPELTALIMKQIAAPPSGARAAYAAPRRPNVFCARLQELLMAGD